MRMSQWIYSEGHANTNPESKESTFSPFTFDLHLANNGDCNEPILQELISIVGVDLLEETLDLPQELFKQIFPQCNLSEEERLTIKDSIRYHYVKCLSCQTQAALDKQLDDILLQCLKDCIAEEKKLSEANVLVW